MDQQSNPRLVSLLRPLVYLAGAAVVLAGSIVLTGWLASAPPLASIVPGLVPMNPLVASTFVLAGISLLAFRAAPADRRKARRVRAVAYAAAALVGFTGLLTLAGYAAGRDLGLDQMLFGDRFAGSRIAPSTGLNFLLIGLALLLLEVETRGGRLPSQFLALATAVITLLALTGYAYGVRALSGVASFIPMTVTAAMVFAVLSVGVLCVHPDRGLVATVTSDSAGGTIARRLLPPVVAILLVLGLVTAAGEDLGVYDAPFGFSLLVVLSIVIFANLIWWNARSLYAVDVGRKQAEEALQAANAKLTGWIGDLERRHSEFNLLSEMGNLLQSCVTPDEAYMVITRFAQQLFPTRSGTLYVVGEGGLIEPVAVWGDPASVEGAFAPNECWALRRGRMHVVDDTRAGLICPHLGRLPASYMCVPMLAQGDALGILYLQTGVQDQAPPEGRPAPLSEDEQRLAATVADQIALALANVKLRESLRAQSIRDPLTGLYNRRYMEESLEREIRRAARRQQPVSVVMLDLDHFKRFNDTFGHEAGDTLLRALGDFLGTHIRREDIACRYGGEEFMLILPEAPADDACHRAEQLREGFKRVTVYYHDRPLGEVSLSLGVAAFPRHGSMAAAVVRAADEALYRAKTEGRDRVRVAL